jgi:uncharacterized membrane protein
MFEQLFQGIEHAVEVSALGIEVLAVAIIVVAVVSGLLSYLSHSYKQPAFTYDRFSRYRQTLGRALLLGLEILVAADIIKTVVLETTFESVSVLGLLVLIRIFLGWSLVVEMEGRWPWQPERSHEQEDVDTDLA